MNPFLIKNTHFSPQSHVGLCISENHCKNSLKFPLNYFSPDTILTHKLLKTLPPEKYYSFKKIIKRVKKS